jgi:hypothetical protein
MQKPIWLNNTVLGAGLTSFFSDLNHGAITVLLPSLFTLLGAPFSIPGLIEGVSDGASSFVKLASGYLADLFILVGLYIAVEDMLEGEITGGSLEHHDSEWHQRSDINRGHRNNLVVY